MLRAACCACAACCALCAGRADGVGRHVEPTTLTDYLWPRLSDLPDIEVAIYEDSPAPGNPLGVRGAGEGGTAGVGSAIANAVPDALQLSVHVGALPLHPERVLNLLRASKGS